MAECCLVADCGEPQVERGACGLHREMLDRVKEELKGQHSRAVISRTVQPTPRKAAPPDLALKIARTVHECGATTTGDLAELFSVSKRTATRNIARARAQGWVVAAGRGGVQPGAVVPDIS